MNDEGEDVMATFFNVIFYMGIFTSISSGVGVKLAFFDQTMAAMYGLMGLVGTGIGYAGRHYFRRKAQVENGQYQKEMAARLRKREEKRRKRK